MYFFEIDYRSVTENKEKWYFHSQSFASIEELLGNAKIFTTLYTPVKFDIYKINKSVEEFNAIKLSVLKKTHRDSPIYKRRSNDTGAQKKADIKLETDMKAKSQSNFTMIGTEMKTFRKTLKDECRKQECKIQKFNPRLFIIKLNNSLKLFYNRQPSNENNTDKSSISVVRPAFS